MRTNVIIVADCSGSMGHLQAKQQEMVFAMIQRLADEETASPPAIGGRAVQYPTRVIRFGSRIEDLGAKPAAMWSRWDLNALVCNQGSTALMDAIGRALELTDAGVPTLIAVFTDGGENASYGYNAPRITALLKQHEAGGNLTLTCAGPAQAVELLKRCGVPEGNFKSWDGSAAEHVTVAQVTTSALDTYVTQRKAGKTRSVSFYVDPSKLTAPGVKAMTKQVQPTEVRAVSKHMAGRSIADFFKTFEPGKHYYQLVKPEYIQEEKDLVVHIKDKDEYRQGSRTVRMLLGLPETGKIRVRPAGESAQFDIFVQSSSVNRKLVEGQKLLTLP